MYIRRIVVPVKNYDIIYIYLYIYKHDRCFCCCFQNSRACSSRLACAFVVQLHVNTQHRSCLHDRCRMTQVAQVNATTSHREAFSFYILFRDVEPGKRAFVSMEFRTEPRISTEIDVSNYYPIASLYFRS